MNLTVEIPDDLVGQLNAAGGDLSRRALDAFALEEYKSGHLTKAELRRLLGFETRYECHFSYIDRLPEPVSHSRAGVFPNAVNKN